MAAQPELYNLVWRAFSFVSRPDPSKGEFQAATHHLNTIDTRPNIPAIILYPALLTPNLHVRGENDGMIEILVAAPSSPALAIDDVNRHLKFASGLDAKKRVSDDDLFEDPTDKIKVDRVQLDPLGQLKTMDILGGGKDGIFRGILHETVSKWLPKELDAYYAIQIDESCLGTAALTTGNSAAGDVSDGDADADSSGKTDRDSGSDSGSDASSTSAGVADSDSSSDANTSPALTDSGESEYQDFLIAGVLQRMNGPALQGSGGFGKYEFEFDVEGVDYSQIDLDQPIVAYHPLYVYPEGSLQTLKIGHVSDIHINARQKLLARSPARVIDAEAGTAESPIIGSMMNTFERSFLSILDALDDKGIDVLLVGGDLIEHVDNAFPYHDGTTAEKLRFPSAAAIWDVVDVDNNYERNYQSYVDYIAFFTAIRHFCSSKGKPVFVVSGNHDAYRRNNIYGISPRLPFGVGKANEGIPADHNLTFYEAMLVFGESWGSISYFGSSFDSLLSLAGLSELYSFGRLFEKKYYEWFYAVLSPFSDFNLQLPNVVLVGLGWGPGEAGFAKGGEKGGHLPRADESVSDAQLAVAKPDGKKKTVLMSHFTFVSYNDPVDFGDVPTGGHLEVANGGLFGWSGPSFGDSDFGTFEKGRPAIYAQIANSDLTSCVLSGHSHRKCMYLLGPADDKGYPTEAYDMRRASGPVDLTPHLDGRPPIIVSDSGGPLPRLNFSSQKGISSPFGEFGSDLPSGTMVCISETGTVTSIEQVYSTLDAAKPRLAVAVDYLHVMKDHVFKEITVQPFDRAQATTCLYTIDITFHNNFPILLGNGMDLILFGKPSVDHAWIRIALVPVAKGKGHTTSSSFQVPLDQSSDFFDWLTLGSKAGRFMSFGFANANGLEAIYDISSRWNIEVEAKPSFWNFWGAQKYDILPHGEDTGLFHTHNEAPNFAWRKQFDPYR